jgi:hypothetical protein
MLILRKLSRWHLAICLFFSVLAGFVTLVVYSDWKNCGPFWDKYQKVQPGMTQQEVEAILGPPLEEEDWGGISSDHSCIWKEGHQTIIVDFHVSPDRKDGEYGAISKRFLPKPYRELAWEKLGRPLRRKHWTNND